jgi:hypothetical protein
LLQDAERFEKDTANVGDVLRNLRADNHIKRSIGMRELGSILPL